MSKDDIFPVSVRFNFNQLAALDAYRGSLSRAEYIRWRTTDPENPAPRMRGKFPVKDHQAIAQLLGSLGNSRLPSNVNQLAKQANLGTLPVTPETEAMLVHAAEAIMEMRALLIKGLGLELEP